MKTKIQQTPPFTSRAENRETRLPLDPYQPYAIKIDQPCTTKEPNSSSSVCFGGDNLNSNWGITKCISFSLFYFVQVGTYLPIC
jgi:hypothetical protein